MATTLSPFAATLSRKNDAPLCLSGTSGIELLLAKHINGTATAARGINPA